MGNLIHAFSMLRGEIPVIIATHKHCKTWWNSLGGRLTNASTSRYLNQRLSNNSFIDKGKIPC